ncbi:MAG: ABC transporter ATP-binding protein [Saprospiraceae bacterium]|nr:ABC transporter ATP-binding protein [Saprospiraceae bacterium]
MKGRDDHILQVDGLTTSFKDIPAVDDLSFKLKKGETLGIVGESGSGKSVTALSIMGLIRSPGSIEKGRISFNNSGEWQDLTTLGEKEMTKYRGKHIGLIFQEPFSAFNPSYTCGSQIRESLDLHTSMPRKEAIQEVHSILERVGIKDPVRIYRSYPHELSGGQLQRALIAMAIICKPDVIIADEPTTALDVTVQKNVLGLFREIVSELNASMIFISHDLGVISEVADQVLVMYRGRKMEYGSTATIFNDPQSPYTKGLLECRPRLDRSLNRLPVIADFMDVEELGGHDWRVIERTASREERQSLQEVRTSENVNGSETLLEVERLTVRYPIERNIWGSVRKYLDAVDSVSFDIKRGETVGLVGESGSGKSSIGKALIRLTDFVEGSILYEGRDILPLSQKSMRPLRKKIQMIFQDPYSTLNPRMKIGTAIAEVLKVHGYKGNVQKRVKELLERVGLTPEVYGRYPHEFSGGQRQRISIARTLAVEPEFIICDESVSALDVSVQAQILNLLKELQADMGLSYLFISHDLSVVKHMSDRILVLKDGKIVEEGEPEKIYISPQHDYTKGLIDAIPGIF